MTGVIGSSCAPSPPTSPRDCRTGHFDTIILNSVVQYFPNAGYLAEVIDNALDLLAPGGALFIGDVRNHTLQGALQTAVALARTPPTLDGIDGAEIRQRVQHAVLGEAELLLAPEFFTSWAGERASVAGPGHRSQTRIRRQRTDPVSLRRHHPQNPQRGMLRWPLHPAGRGPTARA